ncbi:MAG TPA: hypothetical protein VG477_17775, partial [Thermoanaerobaculia bacterium]|nr:hypothetical protein [Thermoanaerobaculia bacterium]
LTAFVEILARQRGGGGFSIGLVSSYRPPLHPGIGKVVGNFSRLVPLGVGPWNGALAGGPRRLQELLGQSLDGRWPAEAGSWPPVLFNSLLEAGKPAAGGRPALETLEVGAYWPGVLLLATVAEDLEGGLECKWQAREGSLPAGWSENLLGEYQCFWERLAAGSDDGWI